MAARSSPIRLSNAYQAHGTAKRIDTRRLAAQRHRQCCGCNGCRVCLHDVVLLDSDCPAIRTAGSTLGMSATSTPRNCPSRRASESSRVTTRLAGLPPALSCAFCGRHDDIMVSQTNDAGDQDKTASPGYLAINICPRLRSMLGSCDDFD